MKKYLVMRGDTLDVIVREQHLDMSAEDIAALPRNRALFRIREPSLLREGDELWLPEQSPHETKSESCSTDNTHRFVVSTKTRPFAIRVLDWRGEPFANCTAYLIGSAWERVEQTDADGRFACEVPTSARDAWLKLADERIPVRIGGLDPLHTATGIQARLANLSYRLGNCDGNIGNKSLASIRRFQAENGLVIDGIVGPRTRAKLAEVHEQ